MLRSKSHLIVRDGGVGFAHAACGALVIVAVAVNCLGVPGPNVAAPRPLPPVQPPQAAPVAALPEPIYWKQHLFLIPYQWGSAAEPGAARAVWLFVSKDRGASWQKISEA